MDPTVDVFIYLLGGQTIEARLTLSAAKQIAAGLMKHRHGDGKHSVTCSVEDLSLALCYDSVACVRWMPIDRN